MVLSVFHGKQNQGIVRAKMEQSVSPGLNTSYWSSASDTCCKGCFFFFFFCFSYGKTLDVSQVLQEFKSTKL